MDFISKYLLRGAGFLVAAQIFLTFGLPDGDLLDKLKSATLVAMMAIPLLVAAAFLTSENALRAVGFTILFWAGGGAAAFFGAVYGHREADRIPGVRVPEAAEVSLGFGIANFACVVLLGLVIWLWGLRNEPPAGTYHDVR